MLDKPLIFLEYIVTYLISESISMWGQFFVLKFPSVNVLLLYLAALPFAWIKWIFTTLAIEIGDQNNLVTPIQDLFIMILVQFFIIILINHYYLKQPFYRSDVFGFCIVLTGFLISYMHVISRSLGLHYKQTDNVAILRK